MSSIKERNAINTTINCGMRQNHSMIDHQNNKMKPPGTAKITTKKKASVGSI